MSKRQRAQGPHFCAVGMACGALVIRARVHPPSPNPSAAPPSHLQVLGHGGPLGDQALVLHQHQLVCVEVLHPLGHAGAVPRTRGVLCGIHGQGSEAGWMEVWGCAQEHVAESIHVPALCTTGAAG